MMKKWLIRLLGVLAFLFLLGLGFSVYQESESEENSSRLGGFGEEMADMANQSFSKTKSLSKVASGIMADESAESASERLQESSARLSIEVVDAEDTLDLVKYEVALLDGEITGVNSWQVSQSKLAYRLNISVLPEELENLMLSLEELGKKQSQYLSVTDVTDQVADLSARLESQRKYRSTLQTLLEQKSDDLESLLRINQELQNVQTKIERLEAQQKNQTQRIKMARLDLTITPKVEAKDKLEEDWSAEGVLKDMRADFIRNTRRAFAGVLGLLAAVPLWGPVLLIGLIIWGIYKVRNQE